MTAEETLELVKGQISPAVERLFSIYRPGHVAEESWDMAGLESKLTQWGLSVDWFRKLCECQNEDILLEDTKKWIAFDLAARLPQAITHEAESCRLFHLMAVDHLWRLFLEESELIRTGIHLRAFANEKPELALKNETFRLFQSMQLELPVVTLDFAFASIIQAEHALDSAESEPAE